MSASQQAERTPRGRSTAGLRNLQLPVILGLITVATGMAYSFWWAPVVRHRSFYWVVPGDIWTSFRVAHYVGWGDLSYSYSANTGLVTLPGYEVILAPIAMISSRFGLIESAPVVFLFRPSTWLLLGPFILVTATVPLFAFDRLARHLQILQPRRTLFLAAAAVVLWPVTAIWGHPEDALALGLVIFAFVALLEGRMTLAGWLLGGAIAMQLFVVLLVPIMMAVVGRHRLIPFLLRASVIPGFLLVAVLIPDFHDSWHALTNQPNYPRVNHATPWVLVAPHISRYAVAAGPGRIVSFLLAAACGILAIRGRGGVRWTLWLAAVAMAGRCVFEAVVDPYYLAPAIVLALIVAVGNVNLRNAVAMASGGFAMVITYWHANMWVWWIEMTVPLLLMLWASYPSPKAGRRQNPDGQGGAGLDMPVPAIANQ